MKAKKEVKQSRRKVKRLIEQGVAYIRASFNNIFITITDLSGDTIAWSSAGANKFKGARKGTPFAGQVTAEALGKKVAQEFGVKEIEVKVNGPGAGRDSAIRALAACGIKIRKIVDITSIPHNGCRPPKKRRS